MNKINFVNLPSTTTPVNATNLNQLQTNVDDAKVEKDAEPMTTGDLNDVKTTKFVYATSGVSNIPATGNFYIMVIKRGNNTNNVIQIARKNTSTLADFDTYERRYYEGTWTDWLNVSSPKTFSSLSTYLQNSWTVNGQCCGTVFPDGTKLLSVSIKSGTDTRVMTLPTALRPSNIVYGIAGNTGSLAGSLMITTSGAVTVGSNLQSNGYACFSIMYQ